MPYGKDFLVSLNLILDDKQQTSKKIEDICSVCKEVIDEHNRSRNTSFMMVNVCNQCDKIGLGVGYFTLD